MIQVEIEGEIAHEASAHAAPAAAAPRKLTKSGRAAMISPHLALHLHPHPAPGLLA